LEFFSQIENACRIRVAAIDFNLKALLAEAENRQIEAGKQRGLDHAGDDAEPDAKPWNGRHGLFLVVAAERFAPPPMVAVALGGAATSRLSQLRLCDAQLYGAARRCRRAKATFTPIRNREFAQ
jgi:hypothetical protein